MFSFSFFAKEKKSHKKKPKTNKSHKLDVALSIDSFKINENDISKGRQLGDGGSGVVFLGKWNEQDVAIKYFYSPDDPNFSGYSDQDDNEAYRDAYRYAYEYEKRMAEILSKDKNSNDCIIQYYGYTEDGRNPALVMELMPKGDLSEHVLGEYPLDLIHSMFLACDVASGLHTLHQKYHIIHCDIKLENILISEGFTAKIADFGCSVLMKESKSIYNLKGTCGYQAPELLKAASGMSYIPYSDKSDIYAFGIVLVELVNAKSAYGKYTTEMVHALTLRNKTPDIAEYCPTDIKAIIESAWLFKPKDRPEISKVLHDLEGIRNNMKL